ncbi:MAG TPA: hypothetical protein VNP96_09950 [Solirubrobacterales bacterium]|nr:hypothetical protein [Solirubrobacterales bacterium]
MSATLLNMRSRLLSTVLAGGVTALLSLAAPTAVAADYPATYKGTTANGGTVEFDVAADGVTVTRFAATQVPITCDMTFDASVEGTIPVVGGTFSNGSPQTGLVFGGFFQADHLAAGTVSYRIVNVRYDGCSSQTVSWTASTQSTPSAPQGNPMPPVASLRSHVLLSYRREGGIAGPGPSLVVTKNRWARVRSGSCTARFKLKPGPWSGLRAALRGARLGAIAGDYLPQRGADIITYVIKAHAGTVRIAPGAGPQGDEAMRQLGPLLNVLDRTVSAGERRMAQSCGPAAPGPRAARR